MQKGPITGGSPERGGGMPAAATGIARQPDGTSTQPQSPTELADRHGVSGVRPGPAAEHANQHLPSVRFPVRRGMIVLTPPAITDVPAEAPQHADTPLTVKGLMNAYHDEITATNGNYGACSDIAYTLASTLGKEGGKPYVLELVGKDGNLLVPNAFGGEVKWRAHMVCGEGEKIFDPSLPHPLRVDDYFTDFFYRTTPNK